MLYFFQMKLSKKLTFGFEQTFTVPNWWEDEGFCATSDTPLKREKMVQLAQALASELNGSYQESVDIWDHLQYETFDKEGAPSFVVTMDPGSIEVKTPPCLLEDIIKIMEPLFLAAEKSGLVPYRQWWYGVRGGTEGGCHVNMGGFTEEENPLVKDPSLVVKYAAYIHNRPWLHYPFMGVDVGPGGNAQRLDEKNDFIEVAKAIASYQNHFSPEETYQHFKPTTLVNEKASFPSLAKFRPGLYLIEDRAQESFRSAHECELAASMRLYILDEVSKAESPEPLQEFKNLHGQGLTSYWLWEKFQYWANDRNINPVPFQVFFDRQFPLLLAGSPPQNGLIIRDGRRPRVVKEIQKRGDTIISKTIDTNYKRFEVIWNKDLKRPELEFEGAEFVSPTFTHEGYLGFGEPFEVEYLYFDVHINEQDPLLRLDNKVFNMKTMTWEN